MPTGSQLSRNFAELAARTEQEIGELRGLASELRVRARAAEEEQARAAEALAATYLPRLDPASLDDAERRTGFRGFRRMNPLVAMEKERQRLERDLAQIRADETYVRREYLVGANGSITRRLAEAREMLDPWQRECARFEDLPSFLELVETQYDTDHFARRWWEPAYWRLWAAGDAVCKALDLPDFGDDVLPAYAKVRGPRDEWRAQVAAIEAERDVVLALVKRHDDDTWRLAHLAEIYLEECTHALAEHLRGADAALLEQWSDEDRGVVVAVRRLAGLGAKIAHLESMADGVGSWASTLEGRVTEYKQKAAKYRYGKRASRSYPARSWSTKPEVALGKSAERRRKLRAQAERISRYDRYDRFDAGNNAPELWWVEFTGSAPSVWTPGLRDWYARHPSVVVLHADDVDHGEAVASTLAGARLDGFGDVS